MNYKGFTSLACLTLLLAACGGSSSDGNGSGGGSISPPPVAETFTVSADFDSNRGRVSPEEVEVEKGDDYSFTLLPFSGYEVGNVEGCGGNLDGDVYVVEDIQSSCTFTVEFKTPSSAYEIKEHVASEYFASHLGRHERHARIDIDSSGGIVKIVRTEEDNFDASLRVRDRISWNGEIVYSAPDSNWTIHSLTVTEDDVLFFWLHYDYSLEGATPEATLKKIENSTVSEIEIPRIQVDSVPELLWASGNDVYFSSVTSQPRVSILTKYISETGEFVDYSNVWFDMTTGLTDPHSGVPTSGYILGNNIYAIGDENRIIQTAFSYDESGNPQLDTVSDITGWIPTLNSKFEPFIGTKFGVVIRESEYEQAWMRKDMWLLTQYGHYSQYNDQIFIAQESAHAPQGCTINEVDENGSFVKESLIRYTEAVNQVVGYQPCKVEVLSISDEEVLLRSRTDTVHAITRLIPAQ